MRKNDGLCLGECGIWVQEVDGERQFEISYRVRRDCWGMGLATEAARACRDYGFLQAGVRRLISIIDPENAASIRVAEKMGMTLEKSAAFHDVSVVIYSVAHSGSAHLPRSIRQKLNKGLTIREQTKRVPVEPGQASARAKAHCLPVSCEHGRF